MLSETISHYRILNPLGANAIGEAYVAEDRKLGRKVVLQIISEQFATAGGRLNRLLEEARKIRITSDQHQALARRYTDNPEAYATSFICAGVTSGISAAWKE